MAIDWDRIDRPKFDRIVNALFHRLYQNADKVEVLDGRGGDGGRDIVVVQGTRLRIFQLKCFPEGFSSQWRQRRNQIKRSFERALQHEPYEWVLVVPCDVTPAERQYVDRLGDGHAVKTTIMDKAALDERLATCPDLDASFTRDVLKENAIIFRQEQAMLYGGVPDLSDRVSALGRVVDQCDDDWTIDFERSGGTIIHKVRAKHPRAHEVSPIHIEMGGTFGPEHADLAAAAQRVLGFGTAEEITFPPEVVTRCAVIGPAWLSHSHTHVQVSWHPLRTTPRADAPVVLRFVDDRDEHIGSHEGVLRHGGRGDRGYSMEAQFHGAADLRFMLPVERAELGTLNCNVRLKRAESAMVLRAAALVRQLRTCDRVEILVQGNDLGDAPISDRPGCCRVSGQLRLGRHGGSGLRPRCSPTLLRSALSGTGLG